VDVSYEPATQRNHRVENLVQSSKVPATPVFKPPPLPPQPRGAEEGLLTPILSSPQPPVEAAAAAAVKSSIFYSFGPSHEFIHPSKIDEILKRSPSSLDILSPPLTLSVGRSLSSRGELSE
jgi:hypothetical protein